VNAPIELFKLLHASGAALDKRHAGGVTPLMMAAGAGREDIVDYLINNGARLDVKDYHSSSIVDWAGRSNNNELIAKLKNKIDAIPVKKESHRGEDFAEDVFVDVKYPGWFKESFLDLKDDLQESIDKGKKGLVVFMSTRRCSYCKAFIDNSLSLADIKQRMMDNYDVLGIEILSDNEMTDIAGKSTTVKDFVKANKAVFTPTMIFYGANGEKQLKIVGYYPPEKFRKTLDYMEGEYYKNVSLREYLNKQKPGSVVASNKINKDDELFAKPPFALDRRSGFAQQPLLVLFEQPNCDDCDYFHDKVLDDQSIRGLVKRFEAVQLNAMDDKMKLITPSGERTNPKQWFKQLDLTYSPALVIFDEAGKEILRLDSQTKKFRLEGTLQLVLNGDYENGVQLQKWRNEMAVRFYKEQANQEQASAN
jgi:thioredoxin-related protein